MPETLVLGERHATKSSPLSNALELVGQSPAVVRALELVRRAAVLNSNVLITAPSGAAVESVAQELHIRGPRSAAPYVIVACEAREPAQLDRLLFGAQHAEAPPDLESVSRESRVAAAKDGTLFLQNVTELPASAQARLARIVRDGEVRVEGAPVATNFRIVASALPGVEAEVESHRFRADLFRRLSVVRIDVPTLRERAEDIPALATRLLDDICAARGLKPRSFTHAALALLGALTWPGNIAELREAIERVVDSGVDDTIPVEHLLPALQLDRAPVPFAPSGCLREARLRFEREYIGAVLQHHRWRMADAAQTLGIQRPNLYRKARQLGIPLTRSSE
jgi:DNA-binding NtrC family response regulator